MNTDIIKAVTEIIENIQTNGDSAVLNYLNKFDGVCFKSAKDLKVTDKQIKEAVEKVSPSLKKAIKVSYANVLAFHIAGSKEAFADMMNEKAKTVVFNR